MTAPFTIHLFSGAQALLHVPIEVRNLAAARAWLMGYNEAAGIDKCEVRRAGRLVWLYQRKVHKWVAYKVETRKP